VSLEENKALVRRFLEEQAKGNLDVIDELLSPDFVDRSLVPGQGPRREDFKRSIAEILDAFSIISFTIEEQIAEGDTVVTKYTEKSVIRGEWFGMPPTGTEENFQGIYIHRISDGKIIEEWSQANTLHTTLERLEEEMRERQRVEHELGVARRIQHALLPKDLPELEGWEIARHYQPAREVGGDFYDFLSLEDGRVGLVIGDVSGWLWQTARACCAPSPKEGSSLRVGCWRMPTRSCMTTSRPPCSLPAYMPYSTPRVGDSSTRTQATICPTYIVTVKPRS
jgi:predicted ester cyclase